MNLKIDSIFKGRLGIKNSWNLWLLSCKFPVPRHLRGGEVIGRMVIKLKQNMLFTKNNLNLRKRNVLKLQLTNGFRSFRRKGRVFNFQFSPAKWFVLYVYMSIQCTPKRQNRSSPHFCCNSQMTYFYEFKMKIFLF